MTEMEVLFPGKIIDRIYRYTYIYHASIRIANPSIIINSIIIDRDLASHFEKPEAIYSPENVSSEFVVKLMTPKLDVRLQGFLFNIKNIGVEN